MLHNIYISKHYIYISTEWRRSEEVRSGEWYQLKDYCNNIGDILWNFNWLVVVGKKTDSTILKKWIIKLNN